MINIYGGGNAFVLMRPPNVELNVHPRGGFFDDDDDLQVFRATEGVFRRITDRVIVGAYQNPQQQGNALGLLLQMVVNNWTYHSLAEAAETAFTRIFEEGNLWRGALHHLIDSIRAEYTNGASNADRVMLWILASMCQRGTPIPYPDIRSRAHQLLLNTHLVPRYFVSVFDTPQEGDAEERNYRILLADLLESIQAHFSALENAENTTDEDLLGALDAIFDSATGTAEVRDDMALVEAVTTGYDRLFQEVVLPEGVLLDFLQGLESIENPGETSHNLIHCILVLLCEKGTHNPYFSVRQRAYTVLQANNALPPCFVPADLGPRAGTAD